MRIVLQLTKYVENNFTSESMIRIAYIILNYKTYHDTIRVAQEILSFGNDNDVIIIVDNCSPNESSNELHKLYDDMELVDVVDSGENGGYAKGNNFGLRYAKKYNPEYVCIINNDIHFSSQTISCLLDNYYKLENPFIISPVQILPNGKIASIHSLLKIPSLLEEIRFYFYFWKLKAHKYYPNTSRPNVQMVEIIPGAFLFLDFKNFQKLGFFDEDTFLFGEEKILAKKIKENGFHNYIILDLNYVHEHSKTIMSEASLAKQRKMILEGKLIYAEKYRKCPAISKCLIKVAFFYCEYVKIVASSIKRCLRIISTRTMK